MRATVAEWGFDVKPSPQFSLNSSAWSLETDGKLKSKYHVAETHLLDRPRLATEELLRHPAGGDFSKVVYLLSAEAVGKPSNCVGAGSENATVSALTDVTTGEGAISIACPGAYTATLVVRDGAGAEVTVRNWTFDVLFRDVDVPEYGPHQKGCANGVSVDGEAMDEAFMCDCDGTRFTGENCEVETATAAATTDDTTAAVIGVVLAVLLLAAGVVFLLVRYQRYTRSMMATDFLEQLEAMTERGEVDAGQLAKGGVPRELKRGWLALIDKLGHGQFGDVWKGLIKDGENTSVPEYMVACKVVKEASGSLDTAGFAAAEEELLKEALLMAQVESHEHLVALIGVREHLSSLWRCALENNHDRVCLCAAVPCGQSGAKCTQSRKTI